MKTIQLALKNVYGVDRIYPMCSQSKLFAALTKSKTLSSESLNLIKNLGYEIVWVMPGQGS
jgi:hypothetical protein